MILPPLVWPSKLEPACPLDDLPVKCAIAGKPQHRSVLTCRRHPACLDKLPAIKDLYLLPNQIGPVEAEEEAASRAGHGSINCISACIN